MGKARTILFKISGKLICFHSGQAPHAFHVLLLAISKELSDPYCNL